jgi:hypothetical protein
MRQATMAVGYILRRRVRVSRSYSSMNLRAIIEVVADAFGEGYKQVLWSRPPSRVAVVPITGVHGYREAVLVKDVRAPDKLRQVFSTVQCRQQ